MLQGIPYDSDEGRSVAAPTAILCGHAYGSRPKHGRRQGRFSGFAKNREPRCCG